MVSVNKAAWDEGEDPPGEAPVQPPLDSACRRVLRPGGAIWVSGTLHNIYSIGMALEQEGFRILNNITWERPTCPQSGLPAGASPTPPRPSSGRRSRRCAPGTISTTPLRKELNGGKQMKDVWRGALTRPSENVDGGHPTQKPEYLLAGLCKPPPGRGS